MNEMVADSHYYDVCIIVLSAYSKAHIRDEPAPLLSFKSLSHVKTQSGIVRNWHLLTDNCSWVGLLLRGRRFR